MSEMAIGRKATCRKDISQRQRPDKQVCTLPVLAPFGPLARSPSSHFLHERYWHVRCFLWTVVRLKRTVSRQRGTRLDWIDRSEVGGFTGPQRGESNRAVSG